MFREKLFWPHFRVPCTLFPAKRQKKLIKKFCKKSKTQFLSSFCPNLPKEFFFRKLGSVTFGIADLHLCAKNQEKLMSQSREKLVTDGRTDERTTVNL